MTANDQGEAQSKLTDTGCGTPGRNVWNERPQRFLKSGVRRCERCPQPGSLLAFWENTVAFLTRSQTEEGLGSQAQGRSAE